MSLKRQIISASSHPAELSVTLSFCDRDSRIWGSIRLNKGDMNLVANAIEMAIMNFKGWIQEEFSCVDDRTWRCLTCNAVISWKESDGIKGVVDLMGEHRLIHDEKS